MVLRDLCKKLYPIVFTLLITGITLLTSGPAYAAQFTMGLADGAKAARGKDQVADLFGPNGTFHTITNVLLFLVGAISVIMLIVGGIRYVVSGGDSTAVANAKNTILYAVVGIVVSILAYAVVSFVITSFSGNITSAGANGATVAPTNG